MREGDAEKSTMAHWVEHRLSGFVDLGLAAAAILVWLVAPQVGWLALPIALLPWAAYLLAGRAPWRFSPFDIPLLIFFVTAALGVWASYTPPDAWQAWWLLVGSALLFYALLRQSPANLRALVPVFAACAVGAAVYFLLTNDWRQDPAKLGLLNQLALAWMGGRPALSLPGLQHNVAAGLIAIFGPFLAISGWRAWKDRRLALAVLVGVAALVCALAFALATSRGATIALTTAVALASWWALTRLRGGAGSPRSPRRVGLGLGALLLAAAALVALAPSRLARLVSLMGGSDGSMTRGEVALAGARLAADFPLIGAGLASFPGLYAHYIQVVPFYVLPFAHNLYLDIAITQGILGALAFVAVYALSIAALIRPRRLIWSLPLWWATLTGLIVILIHGLVDNVVYNQATAPIAFLAFLMPGYAAALTGYGVAAPTAPRATAPADLSPVARRRWLWVAVAVVAVLLVVAAATRSTWLAAWHANLGAVDMARVELRDFPSGSFDDGRRVGELGLAEARFQTALAYDPASRTANHRLGLIYLLRRNFPAACAYLEAARAADGGHRGIQKSLGYCYTWNDQPDRAVALLADIPEARDEMGNYALWWRQQGRPDLAAYAEATAARLASRATP